MKSFSTTAQGGVAAAAEFDRKPLVSIIIDNYNYRRYIGEAIEAALAQTWQPLE